MYTHLSYHNSFDKSLNFQITTKFQHKKEASTVDPSFHDFAILVFLFHLYTNVLLAHLYRKRSDLQTLHEAFVHP